MFIDFRGLSEPLLQFIHDKHRRRAVGGIGRQEMQLRLDILIAGMRIVAARLGTLVVDRAYVVVAEEGAGHLLEHEVVVLVDAQVCADEGGRLHPEQGRDPLDIGFVDARAESAAAVAAFRAVDVREDLGVDLVDDFIESRDPLQKRGFEKFLRPGEVVFCAFEKLAVFFEHDITFDGWTLSGVVRRATVLRRDWSGR